MTEIFTNISSNVKSTVEAAWNIAAAQKEPAQAVEFLDDGNSYRSNRTKSYWISNNRLIPENIFKLPKHRKFDVGDLVLYKNKYVCKVDKIRILSRIYYELTALWEKHINGHEVSFYYITEYNLKSLEKGM